MKKILLLVALCIVGLSGCASSEIGNVLALQDNYAEHFSYTEAEPLVLEQNYELKVTRGKISTQYYAWIPAGGFHPVASSAGRVYYQAPEGFGYWVNGKLRSHIGGIVQTMAEDDSQFYVWFFHSKQHDDYKTYWEIEPNGEWVEGVQPGLKNVESRPWIEHDLILQR